MGKRLFQADRRDIERIARAVPGVAFAELTSADGASAPVLRVVCWQQAHPEETAGRVEIALRDALGVEIEGGDVTLAGTANAPAAHSDAVRIIDLGGNTWATEPIHSAGAAGHGPMPMLPPLPGLTPLSSIPHLLSLSVLRAPDSATVRIEVDAPHGPAVAELSGAGNDARIRRLVCEATALAAAAALGLAPLDVIATTVLSQEISYAIVILAEMGTAPHHRSGVAKLEQDPWHAFALATLQAAAGFR
ncbi:MAG: hypothetical protein NVSMB57_01830 [Actinomycetota bacterium]